MKLDLLLNLSVSMDRQLYKMVQLCTRDHTVRNGQTLGRDICEQRHATPLWQPLLRCTGWPDDYCYLERTSSEIVSPLCIARYRYLFVLLFSDVSWKPSLWWISLPFLWYTQPVWSGGKERHVWWPRRRAVKGISICSDCICNFQYSWCLCWIELEDPFILAFFVHPAAISKINITFHPNSNMRQCVGKQACKQKKVIFQHTTQPPAVSFRFIFIFDCKYLFHRCQFTGIWYEWFACLLFAMMWHELTTMLDLIAYPLFSAPIVLLSFGLTWFFWALRIIFTICRSCGNGSQEALRNGVLNRGDRLISPLYPKMRTRERFCGHSIKH